MALLAIRLIEALRLSLTLLIIMRIQAPKIPPKQSREPKPPGREEKTRKEGEADRTKNRVGPNSPPPKAPVEFKELPQGKRDR